MINWRWPEDRARGFCPWWVILWRVLWFFPSMLCLVIGVLFVAIGWGPREGARLYRAIR